ncbi:3-oxoacid CoA-transferase subunit B [Helicobacter sp. MIT 14-3879]|uniref:3-oxoacid CoA-transferase subunit B n=1 Tax=Helicobacter sp. MIT 14-3879 TaxID=2040649 RepID=UPI000E1ED3A8|nr:3-oxoacid CoA-transferase subunit B [Helicobacter sp. MIT 14-3879]RDU61702.1 succinyl-CoA--3-ketoacid-CoA transferase [Helicobacter sp. MIT 14-3879]
MTKEELIEIIARRVAKEFKDGNLVNLGIGMPTQVSNYIPEGINIILQSENGMLKMGPSPDKDKVNPRITNAGGQPSSILEGGMFFDSGFSFSLIRGGHVDITVLGALEVDEEGNLANWIIPGKLVPGMGGAMDLVNGVKKVIIMMEHTDKNGNSKIKKRCSLPLTGAKVVDLLVTELGVFKFENNKMKLIELQPNVTLEEVKSKTEANFEICL